MNRPRLRGLSLIELMVTITVLGVMLMLAIPGIGNWIQNSRVRTVSEEIQNGLRLAQSEAVNRNRQVAFVRTAAAPALNAAPSATGTNWYIQVLHKNVIMQRQQIEYLFFVSLVLFFLLQQDQAWLKFFQIYLFFHEYPF